MNKTHHTAVVLIPPRDCWEPIQAIRRRHDRQVHRWMPHVTLLYPFRPQFLFDVVEPGLRRACLDPAPFEVRLAEFRHFHHGRGRYTLWLAPEPAEYLRRLQSALQSAVKECSDVSRYPAGFTPHLSVGQAEGRRRRMEIESELQRAWVPLTFIAREVSLIYRGKPPDDAFRVDRTIPLGGKNSA